MIGEEYIPRLVDAVLDEVLSELPAIMLTGPRGCGKTTTALRRASSTLRLDVPGQAAAFSGAPDEVLAAMPTPVLIDEWQSEPASLGAVKRAVDAGGGPGRFLITGSVRSRLSTATWPGTGRITPVPMYGLTQGELEERPHITRVVADLFGPDDPALGMLDDAPGLVDYVTMAARGGFPEAIRLSPGGRRRWYEGYIEHLVHRDAQELQTVRAPGLLLKLLRAAAFNTAGLPALQSLAQHTQVDHRTAKAHLELLEELRIIDRVPAWGSNRLNRAVKASKLYLTDPGMALHLMGDDPQGLLLDANRLGRIVETFVLAQLRPLLRPDVQALHFRDANGHREVDLVLESTAGRIVGVEIKAASTATKQDARHLAWLRDQLGEQFVRGVVLHTGPMTLPLGDRLWAMPIARLWRSPMG
ncbi:MAG: DUF4143 domain-containing protein [Propionibacteriaceae bacterium]|nr:DUF4143 domain-containing protein [Propionibacteriaceae bacterium]